MKDKKEIEKKAEAITRSLGKEGFDTSRLLDVRDCLYWVLEKRDKFWEDLLGKEEE